MCIAPCNFSLVGQAVVGASGALSTQASKHPPPHRSGWQWASGPQLIRFWHTSPPQPWSAWQAGGSGATLGGTCSSETANVGIQLLPPVLPLVLPPLPPPLPPLLPPPLPWPLEEGLLPPPEPLLPPPLGGAVPPGAVLLPGEG